MSCSICSHENRAAIEEALMVSNYGNETFTLKDIAEKYELDVQDLQVHALMHTPLIKFESSDVENTFTSIASEVKKREANILSDVADEYWITLRAVGKQIRKQMNDELNGGAKVITKQMVDLYLGTGTNLRQTLESIVEMNQAVNGEQDSGVKALGDLIGAIKGSKA